VCEVGGYRKEPISEPLPGTEDLVPDRTLLPRLLHMAQISWIGVFQRVNLVSTYKK
jgi:hypothetical protein